MDVSVVLPVVNERENLSVLIPRLAALLGREGVEYEILVVDGGSTDGTRETAQALGARVVAERRRGYAGALETGIAEARGRWLLTLDADLSHEPDFVAKMWRARTDGDIVIASRYVRGGVAYTSWLRRALSRVLNLGLRRMLSMPVRDLSSGFRLYRREALDGISIESRNFEVLEEILVKLYARGFSVVEVPFTYFPRHRGRSHARLVRFGFDFVRASLRLWKLRNSLDSADYEERAFYSIIPLQRYWHRRRHRITTGWARGAGRTLDTRCGSRVIIQSLNNTVAMDSNLGKLRFLRRYGMPLVNASALALPFRDASFDCVISLQAIERLPADDSPFAEMSRVLRPGGRLIVGAADHATVGWRIIEPIYRRVMPGGYDAMRITRYTRSGLAGILARHGFAVEEVAYVARSEMIMCCRKLGHDERARAGSVVEASDAA
jgi:glycosyltransferase involved in cell wall biosynthesis